MINHETYKTLWSILRLGPSSEATTVGPEKNRERAIGIDRRPDVHVQAVFLTGAVDIAVGQRSIIDLSLNRRPFRCSPAQITGGHSGESDVLVLVVSNGGVGGGRDKSAVVQCDSRGAVFLADDAGRGQQGGRGGTCQEGWEEGAHAEKSGRKSGQNPIYRATKVKLG